MECVICGGAAAKVIESRVGHYRDERVDVQSEVFRCEQCKETFFSPDQARVHDRAVKNEIRKQYGLLQPERIAEIRKKLKLTQAELEEALDTGPKVVVRWESGKVIQSGSHDYLLRLLDKDPTFLEQLRQIQISRAYERAEYERTHATTRKKRMAQAG